MPRFYLSYVRVNNLKAGIAAHEGNKIFFLSLRHKLSKNPKGVSKDPKGVSGCFSIVNHVSSRFLG
ncbi:hypothetical protein WCLP8_1280003 [uncultured Gammaproteobacteria bacterium]